MPYQKLVTFYTRQERRMLHAQGIWVDRDGNQIPVRNMNEYRLNKLVHTLANWARKDGDCYRFLSTHPIFVHVLIRIRELRLGLWNPDVSLFEGAYRNSSQENRIWQR